MEMNCRYVSHLLVIPIIDIPYLVNYTTMSHNIYPVMMKYPIIASLIARQNSSIDNKKLIT
jgi:hypothetical protein